MVVSISTRCVRCDPGYTKVHGLVRGRNLVPVCGCRKLHSIPSSFIEMASRAPSFVSPNLAFHAHFLLQLYYVSSMCHSSLAQLAQLHCFFCSASSISSFRALRVLASSFFSLAESCTSPPSSSFPPICCYSYSDPFFASVVLYFCRYQQQLAMGMSTGRATIIGAKVEVAIERHSKTSNNTMGGDSR